MDNLLNCGLGGWIAIAVGAATFTVLILAGAALVKDLFFASDTRSAS